MTEFSAGVYSALKRNGVNLETFAAEMGVSRTYVSRVLHEGKQTEKTQQKFNTALTALGVIAPQETQTND